MTGKRIGYIRVSTTDQNPDRQLENFVLDKKFIDYASAISTNRPQLQAMLEYVREDDIVIVHSMDRLARNLFDLKKIVNDLVRRKIQIQFLKENLVFDSNSNALSNLTLGLMGAFAEFEHSFIKERQREGIMIAKKKGKFKGRKKKFDQESLKLLKEALLTRKSKSQIAREFGVSRFTLYKYLKGINDEKNT